MAFETEKNYIKQLRNTLRTKADGFSVRTNGLGVKIWNGNKGENFTPEQRTALEHYGICHGANMAVLDKNRVRDVCIRMNQMLITGEW